MSSPEYHGLPVTMRLPFCLIPSTIAATQESELETVKNNFLIKKLGLPDTPDLMVQLNDIIDTYGRSDPNKYRAVVYYMLAKRFQKDHIFA